MVALVALLLFVIRLMAFYHDRHGIPTYYDPEETNFITRLHIEDPRYHIHYYVGIVVSAVMVLAYCLREITVICIIAAVLNAVFVVVSWYRYERMLITEEGNMAVCVEMLQDLSYQHDKDIRTEKSRMLANLYAAFASDKKALLQDVVPLIVLTASFAEIASAFIAGSIGG